MKWGGLSSHSSISIKSTINTKLFLKYAQVDISEIMLEVATFIFSVIIFHDHVDSGSETK